MFWIKSGAEKLLALRCIHSSRSLGLFWKDSVNSEGARNDGLTLAAQPKESVLRVIEMLPGELA